MGPVSEFSQRNYIRVKRLAIRLLLKNYANVKIIAFKSMRTRDIDMWIIPINNKNIIQLGGGCGKIYFRWTSLKQKKHCR